MLLTKEVPQKLTQRDISLQVRKPVILESGRMACVPAWEQDLIEQNEVRLQEIEVKRMGFRGRTEVIIAEALSHP